MSSPKGPPIFEKDQIVDGKFRVVRQLGQGGMGAVFEAINVGTNRRVALKVIVSEALANAPDVVTRFQREAKASGSIDSKHVVQVLDTGVEPKTGNPYMVMDYLSGEDLSDLVGREGALPPELVTRIGAQAALGLARAHDAGIIHRDIKSANIFLAERDGGEIEVKLLDFGIAKVRADPMAGGDAEDHKLTSTGSMIGSPLYMSPEQARSLKTLDARTDIWSLGVVLYEALTGQPPLHDKTTLGDLLIAICIDKVPELQARAPWVPTELARIVEKAIEREPDDRFATADDMYAALASLVPSGTTTVRKEMLHGVNEHTRTIVAPRARATTRRDGTPGVATSPDAMPPSAVNPMGQTQGAMPPVHESAHPSARPATSSAPLASSDPGSLAQSAGGSLASSGEIPKERGKPKLAWAVVAALVVVGVGAGGVVAFKGDRARVSNTTVASAQPVSDPTPSASSLVVSPPMPTESASATTPTKTARVSVVAPTGAKLEVDGTSALLVDGALEVRGAPGSLHKIRIAQGDSAQETEVTVLESGAAMPAKITFAAKAPANAGAKPAGGKPAGAPAGAGAAAAPPPATEPTIKKTF